VPRTTTTASIVDKHTPATQLEAEVAALLQQAGAGSARAIQEAEEALSLKVCGRVEGGQVVVWRLAVEAVLEAAEQAALAWHRRHTSRPDVPPTCPLLQALDLTEAKARRDRLAKMRSLLFYQEQKAAHLNKIKSKDYHRKLLKAERRKAAKAGEPSGAEEEQDEAAARAAQEQAEFERAKVRRGVLACLGRLGMHAWGCWRVLAPRGAGCKAWCRAAAGRCVAALPCQPTAADAPPPLLLPAARAQERLTLKHKNTSKWARRALKRGVGVMDAGTKAAIAEQLQMGEQLRRKIEGRGGSGSSSEGGSGYSTEARCSPQAWLRGCVGVHVGWDWGASQPASQPSQVSQASQASPATQPACKLRPQLTGCAVWPAPVSLSASPRPPCSGSDDEGAPGSRGGSRAKAQALAVLQGGWPGRGGQAALAAAASSACAVPRLPCARLHHAAPQAHRRPVPLAHGPPKRFRLKPRLMNLEFLQGSHITLLPPGLHAWPALWGSRAQAAQNILRLHPRPRPAPQRLQHLHLHTAASTSPAPDPLPPPPPPTPPHTPSARPRRHQR
jgi:hypothetical protein